MCCDSGSSSQTVVQSQPNDPEAQRRMAAVAEKTAALADEQWVAIKPYVSSLMQANRELIEPQKDYKAAEAGMQTRLIPERETTARLGLQESARDIEQSRPIKDKIREQQMDELNQSAPLAGAFYEKVLDGVDERDRMGEAQADVAVAAKMSREDMIRKARGMGIDINSPDFQRLLRESADNELGAIAGARTTARREADKEELGNLALGMQVRGRATGLPGTGDLSTGSLTATTPTANTSQVDKFDVTSNMSAANQLYGTAVSANATGMQRYQTGSTTTGNEDDNSFLGMAGGVAARWALGI